MPNSIILDMSVIMAWIAGFLGLSAIMFGIRKMIKLINRS
jgi:hypothetical protein